MSQIIGVDTIKWKYLLQIITVDNYGRSYSNTQMLNHKSAIADYILRLIFTNHFALVILSQMNKSDQRLKRWSLLVQALNLEICHKRVTENVMTRPFNTLLLSI